MRIPVVSGGFDPIHSGHIKLLNGAYEMVGQKVIVLLNSDAWLVRKKGRAFMPFEERRTILESLKVVGEVIAVDDGDGSCVNGLAKIKELYPSDSIVFCNGGDRTPLNIPEMQVEGIDFKFGVGGEDKANSSSWILREALALHNEQRVWGSFHDLYQTEGCKVKELVIKPNSGISYQRHFHRSEVWFVRSGEAKVKFAIDDPTEYTSFDMKAEDVFVVTQKMWHQLYNTSDRDCVIIEIQYGSSTSEDDIERLEFYRVDKTPQSV